MLNVARASYVKEQSNFSVPLSLQQGCLAAFTEYRIDLPRE